MHRKSPVYTGLFCFTKAATIFTWQGKDRHGQARKGEITATSLSEAKNLLRRQGISANKVKKLAKPLFGGAQKIKPADISVISSVLGYDCAGTCQLVDAETFRRNYR